jgi:hypothetical protein
LSPSLSQQRRRRGSVSARAIVALFLLVATARPGGVRAEDGELAWQPSLSLGFGIHNQGLDGSATSTTAAIPESNGDSLISEYFQVGTRVDTPLALDIPTRPRLFLSAHVQIPLAEDLIANRVDTSFDSADPGFPASCPPTLGPGGAPADTCSISLRNRVTLDAMWTLGVGVDFTLPFDQNQFHVAPGIDYYGHSIASSGEFERTSSASGQADFDEQVSVVGNSDVFHGLGPSLHLSVDVYERGPMRFSMFLEGRAIWLLTDQDLNVSARRGADTFSFVSETDDLLVQAAGGVRIQWTGRD